MRILLTVHQFLPKYFYGTEKVTFDTGRELLARGHEVYILTTDTVSSSLPHNKAWDYEYRGLKVRVVASDPKESTEPFRYQFDNPDMAEHARAYMREVRPDLMHAMHLGKLSGSIVPVAKEFGLPVVFTPTDFWTMCHVVTLVRADTGQLCLGPDQAGTNCLRCYAARLGGGQKDGSAFLEKSDAELRAYTALSQGPVVRNTKYLQRTRAVVDRISYLKEVVNMTDRVIAPTKLMRDLLIRNGIDPRRILLSPYGIDVSDVLAAPRSSNRPPTLRVGYIGNIAPRKGVDVLVKAFKDVSRIMPAELKIYGPLDRFPPYAKVLRQLVEGNESISFEGTFEQEKMGWVLSELDVLVIPSAWYENAPLVVSQAFASGTPVVATNLGGLSEIIEHERNGLLFEVNDHRDLSAQLLRLLLEPTLLPRLRSGIGPVRTARESVDDLEVLYKELLGCSQANLVS